MERSFAYLRKYFILITTLKRHVTAHQCIEQNSQRPKICFFIVITYDYFWCHIISSSSHFMNHVFLRFDHRQPKIDQYYFISICNHDVLVFDIPVNYSICMTVVYRWQKLAHPFCCLLLEECIIWLFFNLGIQICALNVLHDQVNILLVIIGFKVLADIWMVKFIKYLHFIYYALHVVNLNLVQDFDSDFDCLIKFVCCLEHFAKGTFANKTGFFIKDVIITQFFYTLVSMTFIFWHWDCFGIVSFLSRWQTWFFFWEVTAHLFIIIKK